VPVVVEHTPNPRARKFTVGVPVGGPTTFTEAEGADERLAPILGLDGVASIFATADFVTVTCDQDADWATLSPAIVGILEGSFS
jgi:hypothetical protein